MGWLSGIAVYAMVWWVVLFAVLPWGVRPADRPGPGHATGAPERPRMWLKAAITSLIAAAIWGGIYMVVESDWISFRDMAK